MKAVLIDIENKAINECFGVSSCLELPFFTEYFGDVVLRNIQSLKPEALYVCSKNIIKLKSFNSSDIEIVDDLKALNNISVNSEEWIALFFSDVYFEAEKDLTELTEKSYKDCFSVIDGNNELIGVFLRSCRFRELISDYSLSEIPEAVSSAEKIRCKYYSRKADNPVRYKELIIDTLKENNAYRLPELAQGVFAQSQIPHGDFVLIPPVYFGEGVQIESGCVIGPHTVVSGNCLLAKNTHIRNSVILKNGFISSGCFLDNVICCENVSVRRNSVVFPDSVLGRDSSLGEESVIENGSYIRASSKVDDFKKNYVNYKQENNQSPAGFYGYTPEKAALLGAATGIVFNAPKIAVASDGELNSTALKLSFLGGLITTGATCYDFGNTFLSSLHYYMDFCELDCAVFISGNNEGTAITIFSKGDYSLSKSDYYNIKNVMTSANIKRCNSAECRNIRQIHGMQRMYIQNLVKSFDSAPELMPVFECENKRIQSVLEIAAAKIGFKTGRRWVLFKINREGTKVTAQCNGIHYSHGKLLEIASFFEAEEGELYLKDFGEDYKDIRYLDALILCYDILEILQKNNLTLNEAYKKLPTFYIAESTLNSKASLSALASEISIDKKLKYSGGELRYRDGSASVRINKENNGLIKIAAKAMTIEAAKEIVGGLSEIINRY